MSAPFGPDDVARVAALAHLALTPDEAARFTPELAEILEFATAIQRVDTSGVSPTAHALAHETAVRADEPRGSLGREDALGNAPAAAREAGLFRVPKVIG
jgi:aspartyl-tRNA(Asn)/glutamyl-tRNA(Gln) amidotransferase subunit C